MTLAEGILIIVLYAGVPVLCFGIVVYLAIQRITSRHRETFEKRDN